MWCKFFNWTLCWINKWIWHYFPKLWKWPYACTCSGTCWNAQAIELIMCCCTNEEWKKDFLALAQPSIMSREQLELDIEKVEWGSRRRYLWWRKLNLCKKWGWWWSNCWIKHCRPTKSAGINFWLHHSWRQDNMCGFFEHDNWQNSW